jgi:lipopolysaccharide assembly protein A
MRVIYGLILVVVVVALAIFAWQNDAVVTLTFLDRSLSCPIALLVGIVYLLGMVTGWTVLGFVSRSMRRVTSRPHE